MEQTINTFNDGLMMDLSPETTPNNVTVNALNATLITNDGGEFVLQQDMGNGRVETAYLPSGYVPVGMKEYGGIIYVASHNPILNKGQIGSFPSPERNLSSEELGTATTTLNGATMLNNGQIVSAYKKLYVFGEELTIRPGDKFALILTPSNLSDDLNNILSDMNNSGPKIVRLRLGVLDANNNLQFIEDDLKQINGYWMYISDTVPSVDDYRQYEQYLNVFNYKISGNLVVVAEIELIDTFEVAVDAEITSSPGVTPKLYDLIFYIGYTPEDIWLNSIKVDLAASSDTVSKYIEKSDGLPHNFNFTVNDCPDGIIDYSITPNMSFGPIDNLTKSGSLDMSKINSGEVALNEWRYYVDIAGGNISISWGMSAYPRSSWTVLGVDFTLYNLKTGVTPGASVNTRRRLNYNGSFLETYTFGTDNIVANTIYLVKIAFLIDDNGTEREQYVTYRWLFTTPMFNQYYFDSSVNDFNVLKPQISVSGGSSLELQSSSLVNTMIDVEEGVSLNASKTSFTGTVSEDTRQVYVADSSLQIQNPNLYPFILNESAFSYSISYSPSTYELNDVNVLTFNGGTSLTLPYESDTSGNLSDLPNPTANQNALSFSMSSSGNTLTITTRVPGSLIASAESATITGNNIPCLVRCLNADTADIFFGNGVMSDNAKTSMRTNDESYTLEPAFSGTGSFSSICTHLFGNYKVNSNGSTFYITACLLRTPSNGAPGSIYKIGTKASDVDRQISTKLTAWTDVSTYFDAAAKEVVGVIPLVSMGSRMQNEEQSTHWSPIFAQKDKGKKQQTHAWPMMRDVGGVWRSWNVYNIPTSTNTTTAFMNFYNGWANVLRRTFVVRNTNVTNVPGTKAAGGKYNGQYTFIGNIITNLDNFTYDPEAAATLVTSEGNKVYNIASMKAYVTSKLPGIPMLQDDSFYNNFDISNITTSAEGGAFQVNLKSPSLGTYATQMASGSTTLNPNQTIWINSGGITTTDGTGRAFSSDTMYYKLANSNTLYPVSNSTYETGSEWRSSTASGGTNARSYISSYFRLLDYGGVKNMITLISGSNGEFAWGYAHSSRNIYPTGRTQLTSIGSYSGTTNLLT